MKILNSELTGGDRSRDSIEVYFHVRGVNSFIEKAISLTSSSQTGDPAGLHVF